MVSAANHCASRSMREPVIAKYVIVRKQMSVNHWGGADRD